MKRKESQAITAIDCLAYVTHLYGKAIDRDGYYESLADSHEEPGDEELESIAKDAGFSLKVRQVSYAELKTLAKPCMLRLKNGNMVVCLETVSEDAPETETAVILDPLASPMKPFRLHPDRLAEGWDGLALLVRPNQRHALLRAFVMAARQHGVDLTVEALSHEYALDENGMSLDRFKRIAQDVGFRIRFQKSDGAKIAKLKIPFSCMVVFSDGSYRLVAGVQGEGEDARIHLVDPLDAIPTAKAWTWEQLEESWNGSAVFIKKKVDVFAEDQPFSIKWFLPEFVRQKKTFVDVGLASVLMQILALATPIYFQILVDKVLVHESFSTLQMLGSGMLCVLVFDAGFSYLRGYLLLYGTSKIDIRVASKTFSKLTKLPLAFFDHASSGVLIKHMQQADKIRQFLTGKLFFTLLDTVSLFIFIPVLFLYSPSLTLLVLLFSALIGMVIAFLIPRFRMRLRELYLSEGQRQSHLVESIHGIQTIKALALEPMSTKQWDDKAAQAVVGNLKVGRISVAATTLTGYLEKLMTLVILWWGVEKVFAGTLSIGALIAFQMLARRVSQPLVQIVSLTHEYQEIALSVEMLGHVMNQVPEREHSQRGLATKIKGKITLENVTFGYNPKSPVLKDINLAINTGQFIGIAGKSGSGKSTLAKLLQGLYSVQSGVIRIDGIDMREIDLPHLRRNVGVVLQDNFLFHGTVRDNIAAAKQDATFEEIVKAAEIAGASEFIELLPQGYMTLLEENGMNLSGGQRQRLAIARTLLVAPPILIFDEATSALDAESEAIIQRNMKMIAKDKTTIVISHRLSMLVKADRILYIEAGKIRGDAPHEVLLKTCPPYRELWEIQNTIIGG